MPPRKKPSKPPKAAPTARGEVTRARLLEVAHALFLKNGFHGTSMRQIAEAAGMALGGIYNHFTNKEDIFAAVLDAYHPYHVVFPALEGAQGETVEAFIRDASQRIRAGVEGAETKLLPLVFTELVEFQGRHLKQIVERLFPTVMAFMQQIAERRGQLRALPLPVIWRTFMGLMIGYLMTEMVLKGLPMLKQTGYDWFGGMVDIYLHGILEEPAADGMDPEA